MLKILAKATFQLNKNTANIFIENRHFLTSIMKIGPDLTY